MQNNQHRQDDQHRRRRQPVLLSQIVRLPPAAGPFRFGVMICLAFAATVAMAGPPLESVLRGEAIDRRLGQPFSMTTAETELIGVLGRVQSVEPIAMWIDPRVDPRRRVVPSDRTTPLANFLRDLAVQSNSRQGRIGQTLVFVPAEGNDPLLSLARLREQQRLKRNAIAVEQADIVWNKPITPSELLVLVGERLPFAVRFETPPTLDYDVWRAGQWLEVNPSEALAAVLVPMDRAFEWTADGRVRITPLAERYEYEADYPRKAADAAQQLVGDRAAIRGRRVRVLGTAAEHDAIAAAVEAASQPDETPAVDWSRQRFTTTLRAKLGELLSLIEDRGMPIAFDRAKLQAGGVDLDQRIEVSLEDATIGEFAAAIAEAAGLESTGDARSATITLQPSGPPGDPSPQNVP